MKIQIINFVLWARSASLCLQIKVLRQIALDARNTIKEWLISWTSTLIKGRAKYSTSAAILAGFIRNVEILMDWAILA
jgi:hypothetical protein